MTQPIFNADAMEEIRKTVRESQRGVRSTGSHQGRWHKKGGGGGSGGAKQMDADEWRRERAKQGGRIKGDALQQQLDALRAQGVIS